MRSSSQEIAELYVEEAGRGDREWLEDGYRFFKRQGRPERIEHEPGPLAQVRAAVTRLRAQGVTPSTVREWIETQTSYTPRHVFAGGWDMFARAVCGD